MLLLFDIDGTLLGNAAQAHSQALRTALQTIHGVDVTNLTRRFSPAGRTDAEIARGLLLALGVSAWRIDERAQDVRDECCRIFSELCPPSLADKVLPGIPELLDWLSGVDRLRLSLVTGNFEPVGRLKLSRAGLGHYFPPGQGGFGSDSEDRTDLPSIARRRAGSGGVSYPRERTIVIGDTPRDIACARADGVRCFAVATGPFQVSELGGADAAVANATELRPLFEDAF